MTATNPRAADDDIHQRVIIGNTTAFMDTWGAIRYEIAIGQKRFFFTFSERFGPLLENKNGVVLEKQPPDRHCFWNPFHMWLYHGKRISPDGVCIWDAPTLGTYWLDDSGIKHFISAPSLPWLGYRKTGAPA